MTANVMVSGGFDPIHVGHLDLLECAAKFGRVIVALNSDEWLIKKKGYCVMKQQDRADILMAVDWVRDVVQIHGDGDDVSEVIRAIHPDMFFNGGDRTESHPYEHNACKELGVVEAFNCGGGKRRSSSALVENPIKIAEPRTKSKTQLDFERRQRWTP